MTDQAIKSALNPTQTLAVTLYGEARGEPIEGRIAVACVIRNRVKAGRFGADYKAVCLKKWQFSCWLLEGGAANYDATIAAASSLLSRTEPSPDLLKESLWIAEGVALNVILDRVKGCTHYMTKQLFRADPPSWAEGLTPLVTVSNHVFFKGVM
jgi:N-acetylmuramoyl-L-alanine amidase